MSERKITIIGREDTQDRGILGSVRDWVYEQEEVSVEQIKSQLSNFLAGIQEFLDGISNQTGNYELESIDINVEISSKGNVSLLAAGGELGGKGGLTLHLKRKLSNEKQ